MLIDCCLYCGLEIEDCVCGKYYEWDSKEKCNQLEDNEDDEEADYLLDDSNWDN